MYDYDYTAASTPVLVSADELVEFREYIQPMLESGADTPIDMDQFLTQAAPALGAAVNESVGSCLIHWG